MPRRRSRRGIVEIDLNLVLADDDFFGNGFDDMALFFVRELGPPLIEVFRSEDDFFFGKMADLHHIELGLSSRDFFIKLAEAVGPGVILRAESVLVDHSGLVEIMEPVDLPVELLALGFEDPQKFGLCVNCGVRPFQVRADLIRRN